MEYGNIGHKKGKMKQNKEGEMGKRMKKWKIHENKVNFFLNVLNPTPSSHIPPPPNDMITGGKSESLPKYPEKCPCAELVRKKFMGGICRMRRGLGK